MCQLLPCKPTSAQGCRQKVCMRWPFLEAGARQALGEVKEDLVCAAKERSKLVYWPDVLYLKVGWFGEDLHQQLHEADSGDRDADRRLWQQAGARVHWTQVGRNGPALQPQVGEDEGGWEIKGFSVDHKLREEIEKGTRHWWQVKQGMEDML